MEAAAPSIPLFSLDGEGTSFHPSFDFGETFVSNSPQLSTLSFSSLSLSSTPPFFLRLLNNLPNRPFSFSFIFSSFTTLPYSNTSYFYHLENSFYATCHNRIVSSHTVLILSVFGPSCIVDSNIEIDSQCFTLSLIPSSTDVQR